jgi:4-amino-4-deoxy-L-arabinose transferase-like glycosyltransferase
MGFLDLVNHLANFLAPALAVALVLAFVGPFLMPKRPGAQAFTAQVAINFVAGAVALVLGLWFFGNDGKMATYAAMLLLSSAAQASSGRWGK